MSMKTYALALMGVGLLLALAACNGNGGEGGGGDNGGSTVTPSAETSPTPVASPPPELCPKIDDDVVQAVVALLELDKPNYKVGEPVGMTLRLVNCASVPKTRNFPDAQRYDFVVKKQDGGEVWRWSEGMAFEEVEGEKTFQPSEQETFTEVWDQKNNDGQAVKPGQFELTAESTGCDESLTNCGPSAVRFVEITGP